MFQQPLCLFKSKALIILDLTAL